MLVDNKIYIFGGRGSDHRTRGSMHVLDCVKVSVSQLKTENLPEPRDGHSCLYFNGKLVMFGGCEGSEDDATLFRQVYTLDLTTREWLEQPTTGEIPAGRDGHAAGILDNTMIVYGGGTDQGVTGDVFALHLARFTWQKLEIRGDDPGPRESTSCVALRSAMYIFGGNVNRDSSAPDIYSSDLYRFELQGRTVKSTLIRPLTGSPPARLSCSLSAVSTSLLIIFGGECAEGMLRDVWVFHVNLSFWRELRPRMNIEGRIAHIGICQGDRLIVFGGLDKNSCARNEIAVLQLTFAPASRREYHFRPLLPQPAAKPTCKKCLHCPKICEERGKAEDGHLRFSYPHLHYMSHLVPQFPTFKEASDLEPDWTVNFLHLLFRVISPDTSQLHIHAAEESKAKGRGDQSAKITVFGNSALGPKALVELTAGASGTVEKQVRCIASQAIFLSRTDDFITCCLLTEDPCGLVNLTAVYDKQGILLPYPNGGAATNRLYRDVDHADIVGAKPGLSVAMKLRKPVMVRGHDIVVPSAAGSASLEEILKSLFFKPLDRPPSIFLNDFHIDHDYAKFTRYERKEKQPKFIVRVLDVGENWPFEERLYYRNFLVGFKLVDEKLGKRKRVVMTKPCDIVVTHESLMNFQACVQPTQTLARSTEVLDVYFLAAEDTPRKAQRVSTFPH